MDDKSINPNEFKIKEEEIPTGENIKMECIKVVAPPNQITTVSTTWPYPINILSATSVFTSDMVGDFLTWKSAPNTTIGTITSDVSATDTIITVSQTVIDNINIGFYVRLALSTNPTVTYEDLGRVINVDKDNLQITVENGAAGGWSTATTLVQMTVYFVNSQEIGPILILELGKDKLGTSHVPIGIPIVCEYDNKSTTDAKTYYSYIQYLY